MNVHELDDDAFIETVAVKLNKNEASHDSELSSLQLLKGVPNVIQLKDDYSTTSFAGHPALIMEYIHGCDAFSFVYERGCGDWFFYAMKEEKMKNGEAGVLKRLGHLMVEFLWFVLLRGESEDKHP